MYCHCARLISPAMPLVFSQHGLQQVRQEQACLDLLPRRHRR
jgi:hypothetical protein